MTLLIMAAGMSSRYGTLKQFEKLGPNSEYLFEFNIYDAIKEGFSHIVVVTNERFVDELKIYLQNKLSVTIKIDVIAQKITDLPDGLKVHKNREKPWGTAHAVWTARNLITNDFVIINADDFYGNDAFKLASEYIQKKRDRKVFGIIAYSLNETLSKNGSVSRGICKVKGNILQSIHEYKEIEIENNSIVDKKENKTFNGNESVSMNFWICDPNIFEEIELQLRNFICGESYNNKEEIYVPILIQNMVENGKINVELNHTSSKWFGMTYANDKRDVVRKLEELCTNGLYPSPLWRN